MYNNLYNNIYYRTIKSLSNWIIGAGIIITLFGLFFYIPLPFFDTNSGNWYDLALEFFPRRVSLVVSGSLATIAGILGKSIVTRIIHKLYNLESQIIVLENELHELKDKIDGSSSH